jgi:hypothetical protein
MTNGGLDTASHVASFEPVGEASRACQGCHERRGTLAATGLDAAIWRADCHVLTNRAVAFGYPGHSAIALFPPRRER